MAPTLEKTKSEIKRAIENQSQWTASIVEFLLDHGSNVHCKDIHGCTALDYAALHQSKYTVDVMEIFVQHGSNVTEYLSEQGAVKS